ncbi:DNA-formamidopyrimidine glycosylase [Candidatus Nomurabacteria bacterium]|nr:DNA-formamidopyrimidine glycosylase [Candidatus Nomurabacteria bacterium]USN94645.1 MAG: DNA-formamidopyrimidine glycosylase [Candidatus Nomurabacteria bacterium]
MPELPEVTTTVLGLNKTVKGKTIKDVWTEYKSSYKPHKNTIKDPKYFLEFKKKIVGKKILGAERIGKNILIHLSSKESILIHMKMTGHLMYGEYVFDKKKKSWSPEKKSPAPLHDPYNRFIRLVFTLSDGKELVLCDSRKFAKVVLLDDKITNEKHIGFIGLDPLDPKLSLETFIERVSRKKSTKIKTALLDQTLISGIGNIYSDEALFLSGISPKRIVREIKKEEWKKLFQNTKKVLEKGIDFGGDSTSDYRNIYGEPGKFQHKHNVYRRKGERCSKKGCSGVIIREVIGGRSSHFCPKHQK